MEELSVNPYFNHFPVIRFVPDNSGISGCNQVLKAAVYFAQHCRIYRVFELKYFRRRICPNIKTVSPLLNIYVLISVVEVLETVREE